MTSQLTNEYSNKSSGDAHLVIQKDAHLMVYLVIHRVVYVFMCQMSVSGTNKILLKNCIN